MKKTILTIMMLFVSSFRVVAQDNTASIDISLQRPYRSRNPLVSATLITSGATIISGTKKYG